VGTGVEGGRGRGGLPGSGCGGEKEAGRGGQFRVAPSHKVVVATNQTWVRVPGVGVSRRW